MYSDKNNTSKTNSSNLKTIYDINLYNISVKFIVNNIHISIYSQYLFLKILSIRQELLIHMKRKIHVFFSELVKELHCALTGVHNDR